jgi:predicted GIY-YIG superfamily endonuclease
VYLIHFSEKYYHAQHYLGFSKDVEKRFEEHKKGLASGLTRAVIQKGIEIILVRTWNGDGSTEKLLKKQKNNPRFCPTCQNQRKEKQGMSI